MAQTVTILSGASQSGTIKIGNAIPAAVDIPTWTSASLTFLASVDGSTFRPLFDKAGEISIAVTTGNVVVNLDPNQFAGVQQLKLRSGTNATPVNQAADRVLTVYFRSTS